MTVSSTTNRKTFAGDNTTTSFGTSPVVFFDTSDLVVYVTNDTTGAATTLVEDTDYTVSGGSGSTGTVSLAGGSDPWGALQTGTTLVIVREVPATQESDFSNNDTSDAEVVEDALDKLTMLVQQTRTSSGRALRQPDSDPTDIGELPDVVTRASKYLAFDSNGDPVEMEAGDGSSDTVTATGSTTARSLAERFSEIINVKDYGATGNGTTDDSTAIQAAITAGQGSEVTIYFPPGTYKVTTGLSVTGPVRLLGAGRYAVNINYSTSNTMVLLDNTAQEQMSIESMTLTGSASATNGAAVRLLPASGENAQSFFRDVTFAYGWIGLNAGRASTFTVDNCYFTGFQKYGIYVANPNNVDSGDSNIVNCLFGNSPAGSTCVFHVSSGGLRVVNNKFNTGDYAYKMSLASGAATGGLIIVGNSMENQSVASIQMLTSGGGATYANIVISGNQIQPIVGVPVLLNDSTYFLSRLSIVGNAITVPGGGTAVTLTNVRDFVVSGNDFTASGTGAYGVFVGSSSSAGRVGPNNFNAGFSYPSDISTSTSSVFRSDWTLLKSSGTLSSCPADTSEDTLATINVPIGMMGLNGALRIRANWTYTNSANNKTVRVKFGGTTYYSHVGTTEDGCACDVLVMNRNAANSQCLIGAVGVASGTGAWSGTLPVSAFDTSTADGTITITGQKANSGETLSLLGYIVEVLPGLS